MNPNELITRQDLFEFEKRLIAKISEITSEITTAPQPSTDPDALLSRRDMMLYLNVSDNTFNEMIKAGLPFVKVEKRARYNRNDVLKFLKERNKLN